MLSQIFLAVNIKGFTVLYKTRGITDHHPNIQELSWQLKWLTLMSAALYWYCQKERICVTNTSRIYLNMSMGLMLMFIALEIVQNIKEFIVFDMKIFVCLMRESLYKEGCKYYI